MIKITNEIVREMRELAAQRDWHNHTNQSNRERVLDFADRLEAAHKRIEAVSKMETTTPTCKDSLQVGNAAKMREALEVARRTLKLVYENAVEFIQPRLADEIIHAGSAIEAALSAPPRNCDLYPKDEVRLAYHLHGDGLMTMQAFADWLFAESKGE